MILAPGINILQTVFINELSGKSKESLAFCSSTIQGIPKVCNHIEGVEIQWEM